MPLNTPALPLLPDGASAAWLSGAVMTIAAVAALFSPTIGRAQVAAMVVQPLVMEASTPATATLRAADNPVTSELEDSLRKQLQQLALKSSQSALPGVQRVDIEVGQLDPRLRLAACQRVEPYLPTGTRLWGKARIGLRCVQGTTPWNVYLPITVKVYGMGWVASNSLAAGAVLSAADLSQSEVDWAEETSSIVTEPEQAVGRTLLRRVSAGQGVRLSDLRPRQWFAAGDVVKVVAIGPGFAISGSGEALSHGVEGQTVRVRTEGGRVVSGQAAGERRVEIRP